MNKRQKLNSFIKRKSEVKQKRFITAFIAVLLLFAGKHTSACDGCYHECYDYTKNLKSLKEPARSIALGLWFGAFSTETITDPFTRDVANWTRSDNNKISPDKKIKEYFKFWNGHAAYIPIAGEQRKIRENNPNKLEKVILPLPSKNKTVFIHVATHHTDKKNSFSNFSLSDLSIRSTPHKKALSAIFDIKLFLAKINSVGGKMESGWGIEEKSKPQLLVEKRIEIDEAGSYDLNIQEHVLKELKKNTIKGYMGLVLQVTTIQAPEELSGVKRLQLIISKSVKSQDKKHLFILSGQSNMAGLNPNISFTPTVESAFGKDNVIVVKDAQGGQPIRRWYKKWKPAEGDEPKATGDLYDRLITNVNAAIEGRDIQTVTFVWMQGERDAKEKHGQVYAESFKGLVDQLRTDLGRNDINFVIGRLSDFDMDNKKYPHWTMVRKAQVAVAQTDPRGEWVDTDDLNDKENAKTGEIRNDLHYSGTGYKTLGKRFAEKAIGLINKNR